MVKKQGFFIDCALITPIFSKIDHITNIGLRSNGFADESFLSYMLRNKYMQRSLVQEASNTSPISFPRLTETYDFLWKIFPRHHWQVFFLFTSIIPWSILNMLHHENQFGQNKQKCCELVWLNFQINNAPQKCSDTSSTALYLAQSLDNSIGSRFNQFGTQIFLFNTSINKSLPP